MLQIREIRLVDIPLGFISVVPLAQQAAGNGRVHIQVDHRGGPGQADLIVFHFGQPPQIAVPFLSGQARHLVRDIGGGIPVRDQHPTRFVVGPPVTAVAGIAVHRKKQRSPIGVYLFQRSHLAVQVHLHQGGGGILIIREGQLTVVLPVLRQIVRQQRRLGRFAAAVQAFDDVQFPLWHNKAPFG